MKWFGAFSSKSMGSSAGGLTVKAAGFLALMMFLSTLIVSGCGGETAAVEYRDPSMQPGAAITAEQEVTIDDLLYTQYASRIAISPDGGYLAWVQTGHTQGTETESYNLFITELAGPDTRQVTDYSEIYVLSPQWSPDGKALAYLSNAPMPGEEGPADSLQVWVTGLDGTPPQPVTQREGGVEDFDWRGDENIVFYAYDHSGDDADDDTVHVSDYTEAPANLYQVSREGGEAEKLTDYSENITDISTSPDGRYAFLVRTEAKSGPIYTDDIPSYNYLLDLETGEEKQVFEETRTVFAARWSPDSKTLYIVDRHSEDALSMTYTCIVRLLDVNSGEERLVDLDWGRGLDAMAPMGSTASLLSPIQDGFIAILGDGCHPKAARLTREGDNWRREMLEGKHQGNIFAITVSSDGKTACYDYSTACEPTQLYAAALDGAAIEEPRQLTQLNPHLEDKAFAHAEAITWEGARGDAVEGMLYYPVDYQPGERYPLVLMIHGGPFESDKDKWPVSAYNWADPYRIVSQKGAFILSPNYHGSANYGETSADFGATMAECKFYEYPLEDIEKAIDRLVELGIVDDSRMGTQGWSGGGMLSNALIATDNRFKAASCGAGGAEWVSLWGPCEFGDNIVSYYFGADPIEDPSLFKDARYAPFYDAGKVTTPTIMFTGDADANVPAGMTWVTYRGIQLHGQAPVELYIFPGEPHVLSQLSHKRRKLVEEQEWFDKYLFSN
jgi:dipeptidyl aminopeptidase/acylaminoacyl peptidase